MALTDFDALDRVMADIHSAWDGGKLEDAERLFRDAWASIPEPRREFDCAQFLSTDAVSFFVQTGQSAKANEAMSWVREAYDVTEGEDAYVDFLQAKTDFDAGNLDAAYVRFDSLFKAYGKRPFADEDPKYLAFYQERK